MGTDILKVVEAQPALLLQEGSPLDNAEVRSVLPSSPQPGMLSSPSDPLLQDSMALPSCGQSGRAKLGLKQGVQELSLVWVCASVASPPRTPIKLRCVPVKERQGCSSSQHEGLQAYPLW